MRKIVLLLFICLISFVPILAQNAGVSGRIIDSSTGEGISGAMVRVSEGETQTSTADDGSFNISVAPGQGRQIIISKPGFETQRRTFNAEEGGSINIGDVFLYSERDSFDDIPTIEVADTDDESDFGDQNIISLMGASDDIYLSESAFKFGAMRYRVRGHYGEYTHTYINGVNFNDQIRGRFNYSMLGGLNDATRNKSVTMGSDASRYGFGDIGGISHINTRATVYDPGGKVTTSLTNRSYKLRGMATYSTGLMDNNLAITGSLGYRWADEGFIEGTTYNSFGYFLSVEKILGERDQHAISLVTFGAPNQRGRRGGSFQEAYDLTDNNFYNPYWGYQNGEKRNSRIATSFDPVAILSHKWEIDDDTELTTGIGARYNQYGTTALNWYNSADPRPDYYRYLPSWQNTQEMKDLYAEAWRTDESVSQIDWDRLYAVNRDRDRSLYMVEERHNNLTELTLNSVFRTKPADNQTITAGVELRASKGMSYKTVNDLLGSEYWLDVDQFAERDFPGEPEKIQNDLNNPNRHVSDGDVFGYDYDTYVNSGNIWFQNEFSFPQMDLYYAAKLTYTSFYRDGNMKNGRAPENSYGKGEVHDFVDQGLKAGGQYKITGRHVIGVNALYETRAPLPLNAYLSSRTRDDAVPELKSEQVVSGDLSYMVSTPLVEGRITAFQTNFYDQNEKMSFYHDSYRTFVNYAMTGIRKIHRGVELGLSIDLTQRLTLEAVGSIAEYQYKNRPTGHVTYENASRPDTTETVYLKDFYVGGTPQTAGSIGLDYFHPSYWFFGINYNHFDRNYVDVSPVRRTPSAVDFQADNQAERNERVEEIVEQEKYAAGGTLDLSVGKSIRFDGGYYMSINLNVNNVLNNTSLKSGGYEQGRFDYDTYDVSQFPPRYYYSQGLNYFLNVNFRF